MACDASSFPLHVNPKHTFVAFEQIPAPSDNIALLDGTDGRQRNMARVGPAPIGSIHGVAERGPLTRFPTG